MKQPDLAFLLCAEEESFSFDNRNTLVTLTLKCKSLEVKRARCPFVFLYRPIRRVFTPPFARNGRKDLSSEVCATIVQARPFSLKI